jgi:hypothetical protein
MTRGHALTGLLAGPSRHEIAAETVFPANPAGDRSGRASVSRTDASPFAAALRSFAYRGQSPAIRGGLNVLSSRSE